MSFFFFVISRHDIWGSLCITDNPFRELPLCVAVRIRLGCVSKGLIVWGLNKHGPLRPDEGLNRKDSGRQNTHKLTVAWLTSGDGGQQRGSRLSPLLSRQVSGRTKPVGIAREAFSEFCWIGNYLGSSLSSRTAKETDLKGTTFCLILRCWQFLPRAAYWLTLTLWNSSMLGCDHVMC